MKSKVVFSAWCIIISIISALIIFFAMYISRGEWVSYLTLGVLVMLLLGSLFYMPVWVSADDANLRVHRPLRDKVIPLSQISSVKLIAPTMAEIRICGSGGWFGYWGWFKERTIGKYFAYYGKASDCFLVVLKNGRQYLLGCSQPEKMVSYLESRIGS